MSSLTNPEWEGEIPLTGFYVEISKVGGGTVGRRYDGLWEYAISRGKNGRVVMCGRDLRTGTPKSHSEAAYLAIEFYRGDSHGQALRARPRRRQG